MNAGIESIKSIEKRETGTSHMLRDDFSLSDKIQIPPGIDQGYSKLGENGRESVHASIEHSLSELEARILSINEKTSFALEQYTTYG